MPARDTRASCPRRPEAPLLRSLLLLGVLLALTGCLRGSTSSHAPIHPNPNMDLQPKYKAQAESNFFYDGKTMRPPVPNTVARGELEHDRALLEGRDEEGAFVTESPVAVNAALLARGAERYGIYCLPCHGERGDGRGMLFERAQIQSGNLVGDERIRDLSDGEIFEVITNGKGLMQGYRYPVPAHDRWAIIAHVRSMQRGEP